MVVIDQDLGVSGRFGSERDGFREVVAKVCLGEVGAVFGLEVSRLARSSAEFARLTDTLVVDADGGGTGAGRGSRRRARLGALRRSRRSRPGFGPVGLWGPG
jgi:hypothetical protein